MIFESADYHGIAHRGPYVVIHRGDGWLSQPPRSAAPEWFLIGRHLGGLIEYTEFTPLHDRSRFHKEWRDQEGFL